ncbi:MAG: hypothetical protein ACTS4U_00345 [Candidatus Hodgkinia cicadicola]
MSNVTPKALWPPKAEWNAQTCVVGAVAIKSSQFTQTSGEVYERGEIATAETEIALERNDERIFVIVDSQVPRAKMQELGGKTDTILAKTSLKGPVGVFERT